MVKPLLQLIHTKNLMYSMLTIYDIIIVHDVLNKKNSPELTFYGCRFRFSGISIPVNPNYKLITLKSRRYSEEDKKFVEEETKKLLNDGLIEEREQVLISNTANHKKRLVSVSV